MQTPSTLLRYGRKDWICVFFMPLILICTGPMLWAQRYELTEVDILGLQNLPPANEITVKGIGIDDRLDKALARLGIFGSSFPYTTEESLRISPGFNLRSADKKTVEGIVLGQDFGIFHGKTREFFALRTLEAFKSFARSTLREPDFTGSLDMAAKMSQTAYYYLEGYILTQVTSGTFTRMLMELTSPEDILERANKLNLAREE